MNLYWHLHLKLFLISMFFFPHDVLRRSCCCTWMVFPGIGPCFDVGCPGARIEVNGKPPHSPGMEILSHQKHKKNLVVLQRNSTSKVSSQTHRKPLPHKFPERNASNLDTTAISLGILNFVGFTLWIFCFQKRVHQKTTEVSSFFKVTFWFPKWRSRFQPWKRSPICIFLSPLKGDWDPINTH